MINKILSGFLFPLFFFLFAGCSGSRDVQSLYNENQIKIDGRYSDWNNLTSIKGENIAFGFRNDSDDLYLCMVTNDRNKIMKILRGGLDIWLDPENSDYKFGIRYPEKPDEGDFQFPQRQRPQDFLKPDQNKPGMREQNEGKEFLPLLSKQKDLYIINSDNRILKTYPIDGKRYQAKISFDKGNLCYEIKIPIGESLSVPYGLKINKEGKIHVEFITGEISSDFQRNGRPGMDEGSIRPPEPPSGGGFPDDGPGGMGGGPGGGGPGGGFDHGGNKKDTSPIDYSFNLTLHK